VTLGAGRWWPGEVQEALTTNEGGRTEAVSCLEERGNQWRRILLYSAIGLAGTEGFFGLFSDLLDNGSQLGDAVGHLVGLPLAFAIFVVAMASVLQPGRRRVLTWFAWTAVFGTFAYVLGYGLMGPPVDFALSITVTGVIFGLVQRSALRKRGVAGGGRCVTSAITGYTLGAITGVAVAIVIAPHLPDTTLAYGLLTAILGFVAGAVGGAINGHSLSGLWWTRTPADSALAR